MRKLWIVLLAVVALIVTLNFTSPKSAQMNDLATEANHADTDRTDTVDLVPDIPLPQPISPDDYPFTLVAEQYPHIAERRHDEPMLTVTPGVQMISFSVKPDPFPHDRLNNGEPVYYDLIVFTIEDGAITSALRAEYPQPSHDEAVFTDLDTGEVITWSFAELMQQSQR